MPRTYEEEDVFTGIEIAPLGDPQHGGELPFEGAPPRGGDHDDSPPPPLRDPEDDYRRGLGVTPIPIPSRGDHDDSPPRGGYTKDSPHFWDSRARAWRDENGDIIPNGKELWGMGDLGDDTGKPLKGLGVTPILPDRRETPRQQLGVERVPLTPLDASDARSALSGMGGKKGDIKVENLRVGIYTQAERRERPLAAMDDCRNFLLNKKRGALVQRYGYTADNAGTITDAPALASIDTLLDFRKFEGPYQNYTIYVGTGSGNPNVIQTGWYRKGAVVSNNRAWGQSIAVTASAEGANTLTTTLTNAAYVTNYFAGGVIYNATRGEYLLVFSSAATPNVVLTFVENLPTDWVIGDTYTFYRDFHDSVGIGIYIYNGSTTLVEPVSLLSQGADTFLFSFPEANGNLKPVVSTYINKAFFNSAANTFNHTYVCEAEIKSTAGFTYANASSYASVGTGLDSSKRYFIGFVYQTDDGQLSTLISPGTPYLTPAADQGIQTTVTIDPATMNKRFKYLSVFLGETPDTSATTLDWNKYYYITQYDLTGTGWTNNPSTATEPANWTRVMQFNVTNWNSRQETLVEHLGTDQYTSSPANFKYASFVGNRLFTAGLYSYPQTISYSTFSGAGVPQYNLMSNVEGAGRATLPGTDSITGLERFEDALFVARSRNVNYISVGSDPSSWALSVISKEIGCDAPQTLRSTPTGVIWANSGMGLYLWRSADIIELSKNNRTDFQNIAVTNKTSWVAWYDSFLRTINFMLDDATSNNKKDFYTFYTDIPVNGSFAMNKHRLNVTIDSVITPQGAFTGQIYFSQNASANTFYFSPSSFDDSGTAIKAYFDTGEHSVDESQLAHFSEWYMSLATSGTKANDLDIDIYIGGSLLKDYNALTKTNTRFRAKLPIVGSDGMTWRMVFNSNATPATFVPTTTADPYGISIYEFGFDGVELKDWVGDAGSQKL